MAVENSWNMTVALLFPFAGSRRWSSATSTSGSTRRVSCVSG
jgi:hypothetical protein